MMNMNKIFLLIICIIITSLGLAFSIFYLNLLTMGYSFFDYLFFILTNFYTLMFPIGGLLLFVFMRKKS